MFEEKAKNGLRWVAHEDLKFRIKFVDNKKSIVWVSKQGVDICFLLILYDFIDRCQDELNINLDIDASWYQRRGFIINDNEVDLLLAEIVRFIDEWEIEPDLSQDKIPEEKWYS